MYNPQETALRIKNIAKSQKISIRELQEKCELGKNAINQLADSQDGMKSKNICMIADYLNVSVDYLLGRTEETSEYNNNINNFDTTVSGTQANVIHKEDDNLNEVKSVLNQLSKANRLRAVADILDLIEEKYLTK